MSALLESDSDFEMVPGAKHGAWRSFDDVEDVLEYIRDGVAALETRIGLPGGQLVGVAGVLYMAAGMLAGHGHRQESEVLLGILPSQDHQNLRPT